jgi:DNA-binding MarR family transcriptional regulator
VDAHRLAMSLRAAYLAMHRRTDAALRERGVTADQFVVLAALGDGAASTQRELVGRAASDANTLRAMLLILERRGLVERRPHPTDRRARSVALTEAGRAELRELWAASERVRAAIAAGLGASEARALAAGLGRLAAALGDEERSNEQTRHSGPSAGTEGEATRCDEATA